MARTNRTEHAPERKPRSGRWKHGSIPVLGLIGAIGAGKSSVASKLAERGALVLDADAIGHALLDQRPAREQVVARFGPAVLDRTREADAPPAIDRRALGAIVFADRNALKALETILHPRMRRTFGKAIERAVRRGKASAVVLDAAILLEKGWEALCDLVVFVDAPDDQRLARLTAHRGWTESDLRAREAAQWPVVEKRRRADMVVTNDGDLAAIEAGVERLWSDVSKFRPPRPARQSSAGVEPPNSAPRPAIPSSRAARRPGGRRVTPRKGFPS